MKRGDQVVPNREMHLWGDCEQTIRMLGKPRIWKDRSGHPIRSVKTAGIEAVQGEGRFFKRSVVGWSGDPFG